jgi:hypothetical protein
MTSLIVSVGLALAIGSTGQQFFPGASAYNYYQQAGATRVMPPGPGYGWGFPNGNPDGYGFWDPGDRLPLGLNADRTVDYFFRRYYSARIDQMFMTTYYNPYLTKGQRYIPYTGCAPGFHPAGGPALGSANTPLHPYQDTLGTGPRVSIPEFNGRVEAAPVNSGSTGLTP